MINKVRNIIRLNLFKKRWRKLNKYNFTRALTFFPIQKVKVGRLTYGNLNIRAFNNPNEGLEIGDFCSIADEVLFILGGEHPMNLLMTFPINKYVLKKPEITLTKGKIIIEDDVWIGQRATILSGVRIGRGAVIGAGSIVTKDVPPFAIFAGNKIIRMRFSNEKILELLKLDYKLFDDDFITKNITLFQQPIENISLDTVFSEKR